MAKLWLLLIGAAIGFLLGRYRVYSLQTRGEALVADRLMKEFAGEGYHLLNNVTVKVKDGTTQIDHVLVAHCGIFVVESKHYSGRIYADRDRSTWTQYVGGKKSSFQNPKHQNYKHLLAVRELLDFVPNEAISPIVVFTGSGEFKNGMPDGVVDLEGLVQLVRRSPEGALSRDDFHRAVGRLECGRLALTRTTDVEHVAGLRRRLGIET